MRVIAVAHDPGAANVVAATASALIEGGIAVQALAKGPARRRFEQLGVAFTPVAEDHRPAVRGLGPGLDGDLVLAGTSEADAFEQDVIVWAHEHHRPSVALLDYWGKLRLRFERRGGGLPPLVLPDVIGAVDEVCAAGCVAEGLPADRVQVLGHPYFGWLLERSVRLPPRPTLGVLFASQPDANEVATLGLVAAALRRRHPIEPLTVRFHPRQPDRAASLQVLASAGVPFSVDETPDGLTSALHHRVVLGIGTILLAEAALCGVPAGSVILGGPDRLGTNRSGLTTPLTTEDEVAAFLTAPPPPRRAAVVAAHQDAHRRAAALCLALGRTS